ncbi:MAG: hypothetical protein OXC26_23745 [Albidovulum sp.]|nr:hypothetical protein [Albidovulum sp.]
MRIGSPLTGACRHGPANRRPQIHDVPGPALHTAADRRHLGVRQELDAHFNLIAMARLFSNHGDGIQDEMDESDRPRMKTNSANALAMLPQP